MTDKQKLIVNRFYWVRVVAAKTKRGAGVPIMKPLRDIALAGEWQPARFTGISADTHAREVSTKTHIKIIAYHPETWDFIGQRSDEGHHFVDVLEVGEQIVRPIELPTRAVKRKKPVANRASKSRKLRQRGSKKGKR